MRYLFIAISALILTTTNAAAQTVRDLLKDTIKKWDTPTEPFRVIDNVYYVGTYGLAVYLLTSPQGHILIDSAMPEATPLIEANIQKLGIKLSDIKYLLNTHAHMDHTGGLAQLKKDLGAQLVSGEKDKPLLEGGYYPGRENEEVLQFPPVKVDRVVHEGDTVSIGNITLTAHETHNVPP